METCETAGGLYSGEASHDEVRTEGPKGQGDTRISQAKGQRSMLQLQAAAFPMLFQTGVSMRYPVFFSYGKSG